MRWRIRLTGPNPQLARPQQLHGLVAGWLERGLSAEAHAEGTKPYTCTLVTPVGQQQGEFDISVLRDDLADELQFGVAAAAGSVRIGRHQFRLDAAELVGQASWEQILDAAQPARLFNFRFHSPTTFRSGRISQPLPLPGSVFGHYRSRWMDFAPSHLRPDIDFATCSLVISHLDGHTEVVEARHQKYTGFVGDAQITAHGGTDRDRRVLAALALLSPFCGTGSNTTIGMGDTAFCGFD